MEEDKRYFKLGLFVFLTVLVLAAILFILGGRSLFQPTYTFETYFNESVAGLDVGAPVKYRGVPLGQVIAILGSSVVYEADVPLEKRLAYIVVRAKVSVSREQARQLEREVGVLITKGLRAQTQLAGITGQQFLSLDFVDPQKYPPLPFDWTPEYQYVPSVPSLTGEIIGNAQKFLASLNEANVKELGQNLNKLVVRLNGKVDELPVAELSSEASMLLKDARRTVDRVEAILAKGDLDATLRNLDSASARLDKLLADGGIKQTVDNAAAFTGRLRRLGDSGELDRMVKSIEDMAARIDGLVGDNQYDVRVIVQDLRVTANNLRTLSETLKRYPAGALVGGPPEKVQLPGKSP
jgi:phospholipid/cholesterol/gamma-HCH transport system substrate-binding protein/paraquat-inducible protein B